MQIIKQQDVYRASAVFHESHIDRPMPWKYSYHCDPAYCHQRWNFMFVTDDAVATASGAEIRVLVLYLVGWTHCFSNPFLGRPTFLGIFVEGVRSFGVARGSLEKSSTSFSESKVESPSAVMILSSCSGKITVKELNVAGSTVACLVGEAIFWETILRGTCHAPSQRHVYQSGREHYIPEKLVHGDRSEYFPDMDDPTFIMCVICTLLITIRVITIHFNMGRRGREFKTNMLHGARTRNIIRHWL